MNKVELRFANLKSLWEFELSLSGLPLQVDTEKISLIRLLGARQLSAAIKDHNAIIVNRNELLRYPDNANVDVDYQRDVLTHADTEKVGVTID